MNVATCSPCFLFDQAATAFGPDASRIREELSSIESGFGNSVFFAGSAQTASDALWGLAIKAGEDDWDSEGGSKISEGSLELALKLLKKMPRDWPAPDVDLDSDGDVAFEWYAGPGRRLSVSVGKNGKLSYAWMIPNYDGKVERNYGVAESQGVFPETISGVVSRLGV
jgi:hypothetical protein